MSEPRGYITEDDIAEGAGFRRPSESPQCQCRQGYCCGCLDHPTSVGPGFYNTLRWLDHHNRCPRAQSRR